MANQASTGLYSEDLYCSNPLNLINNEVQTLQTPGIDDYYFIIPFAAPYFVGTLKVYNADTGVEYKEGVDYVIGHYFVDAMKSLKQPVAGSIRFVKRSIKGRVRLVYHTVGGQWGFNAKAVLAELSNKRLNPVTRSWEQIDGLPARFPSIAHDQSVDQMVGSKQIEEAINGIADALEAAASGQSASHVGDKNNPHKVTAAQVGLGSVVNLPLATLAQALQSTFAAGYMTPQTVHYVISSLVLAPLKAHTDSTSNPHNVTKSQVGLSRVPNLALASAAEAIDPLNNAALMSPYTTALMIEAYTPTDRLDKLETAYNLFIKSTDNPHKVTAAQVGTLTTEQIKSLLSSGGGGSGGNAVQFDGRTFDQVMEMVVETTEMQSILDQIVTAWSAANTAMSGVAKDFDADLLNTRITRNALVPVDVVAGDVGYAVVDGTDALFPKAVAGLTVPASLASGKGGFALNNNCVLSIAVNGSLTRSAGGLVPHSSFATGSGFVAANKLAKVAITKTAIYMLTQDSRLVRTTSASNSTTLNSNCANVWCNSESAAAGEMVVFKDKAGTVYAYGLAAFVTAFNALISAWSTAGIASTLLDVVISETHIIALFGSGEPDSTNTCKVYSINRSAGVALTEVAASKAKPMAISGSYGHSGIVYADGSVVWFGAPAACEAEVDFPVAAMACGKEYTVFIDKRGNVEYWGSSAGNALSWTAEVMYEHA